MFNLLSKIIETNPNPTQIFQENISTVHSDELFRSIIFIHITYVIFNISELEERKVVVECMVFMRNVAPNLVVSGYITANLAGYRKY